MNVVSLMVHLELGHKNTALLTLADALAKRLDAGVMGVVLCQPMRILYSDGYVPGDIIEQDRRQIADEMKAAQAEFRSVFGPAAAWRETVTYLPLAAQLSKEACCADLVVTGVERTEFGVRHVAACGYRRPGHAGWATVPDRPGRDRDAGAEPCRGCLEGLRRGTPSGQGRVAAAVVGAAGHGGRDHPRSGVG